MTLIKPLYFRDPSGSYIEAPADVVYKCAEQHAIEGMAHGQKIRSSAHIKQYMAALLRHRKDEAFCALWMDADHTIIRFDTLFHGSVKGCQVAIRSIMVRALELNASNVMFVHNHPSGHSKPSQADARMCNALFDMLDKIDVTILDNLIVGRDVLSFVEEGYPLNDASQFYKG